MSSCNEPPSPIQTSTRKRVLSLVLIGTPWLLVVALVLHGRGNSAAAPSSPAISIAPSTRPATSPSTAPVFLQSGDVTEGNVGRWGQMQYVPIVLEMPEAYATVAETIGKHDQWIFTGQTREQAMAMMVSCGVTAEQLALIPADAWQSSGTSASVTPPDALLLALSESVRSKLYSKVMADPANDSTLDPMWFRVGRVDFRLRSSGLSDASMALLKRLLYPGPDSMLLFNDERAALRAITDADEQTRFLKAIERKRSLMARLLLTPASDTAALAKYWGKGGREVNLLPLLDSVKYNAMAGVENPGRINILSLLPPFAQERLYQHASMFVPRGRIPDDCYWTAFNFFSSVPDDRVHELAYFSQLIDREYVKIDQPSELGDVIFIADEKGDALHAANYIADNVVFTKNGINSGSPWMLAPIRDVIDTYRIKHGTLKIFYFRKRDVTLQ